MKIFKRKKKKSTPVRIPDKTAEKAPSESASIAVQEALAYSASARNLQQSKCRHLKGGCIEVGGKVYPDGLLFGTAGKNYSIITHRLPNGDWMCICQRCQKEWHLGDPDYEWALKAPTSNRPSSGVVFGTTLTLGDIQRLKTAGIDLLAIKNDFQH